MEGTHCSRSPSFCSRVTSSPPSSMHGTSSINLAHSSSRRKWRCVRSKSHAISTSPAQSEGTDSRPRVGASPSCCAITLAALLVTLLTCASNTLSLSAVLLAPSSVAILAICTLLSRSRYTGSAVEAQAMGSVYRHARRTKARSDSCSIGRLKAETAARES